MSSSSNSETSSSLPSSTQSSSASSGSGSGSDASSSTADGNASWTGWYDSPDIRKKRITGSSKEYHERTKELAAQFHRIDRGSDATSSEDSEDERASVKFAAGISLVANFVLLIIKAYAGFTTGSVAVIASTVDSFLDVVSGGIFWATSKVRELKSKRHGHTRHYPVGTARMEPITVLIYSALMASASLQLITESIQVLVGDTREIDLDLSTFIILGSVVVIKSALWLYCSRLGGSTTEALADDHRNDVLSNSISGVLSVIASEKPSVWWLDPVGAMIIALIILVNWIRTGYEEMKKLTGHRAPKELEAKLLYVASRFDPRIQAIDTLDVFHAGSNFIIEIHLVLDKHMRLKEAHDIGEGLTHRLEEFSNIERAFVHLDYNAYHASHQEHKVLA